MGFACLKPVQCLGPALRGAWSSSHPERLRCRSVRWCTNNLQPLHSGPTGMSTPATQWAQQLSNEKPLTVLEGRERLRELIAVEAVRIAGVTFDGRQELVAALQPEQALMLVKEPSNEYDPNAIRVQTLSGAVLGYVPRDLTARFPYDVSFGHVHHLGQVPGNGNWGALVAVQPDLPPLTVDALPDAAAPFSKLSSLLPRDDWERLNRQTCRRASYRCEISGGTGTEEVPVQAHEVWEVDDEAGVVRLAGLQARAAEVQLATRIFQLTASESRLQTALWTLQAINEWSVDEACAYLKHAGGIREERNQKSWRFDWSWLEANDVTLPQALTTVSL